MNPPRRAALLVRRGEIAGDKKTRSQSFLQVRGKKVSAEVVLPAELIEHRLFTTPERMLQHRRISALGVLSGTIGVQGTTPTAWRPSTSLAVRTRPAWLNQPSA